MAEEELPEIYLQEDNPAAEEAVEVFGRGARERKVTRYDDGLTEEQWLMAVDAEDDSIEDAIARKQARDERRKANKERRSKKSLGPAETSPEPSREASATPQQQAREQVPARRGRGRRAASQPKRKAEEQPVEEAPPKRKRGRQSKAALADKLSPSERAALQKALGHVYTTLTEFEQEIQPDTSDEEDGATEPVMRSIISPFMKPPPKSQYPDYYVVIQNPIAMDSIKKKINREEYNSLSEFRDDIRLLCNNARTYNEDSSLLFQDANDIEALAESELQKQAEKYPELGPFDGAGQSQPPVEDAADAPAGEDKAQKQSAGASPVDAPAVAASGPKLKLTFNTGGAGSKDTTSSPKESGGGDAAGDEAKGEEEDDDIQ
ncbi:putative global transcription activator SNF2L2 [Ascosphaera atra]|nr:putative global transcription activator SNF2L2 [Ascosphaera atra]